MAYRVIVDAGHGGRDPGAVYGDRKEKDDTLVCRIIPEKQDQVKIYREGTICSYAPEFGKTEQIQVLALAWEGDGSEHMTQIIFEREREKHHD